MKVPVTLAIICAAAATLAAAPTFHKDIEPILQNHCQGCHHPGDIGPMSLMTYRDARPWAKAIREAVLQKKMPPWYADPGHGEYLNNPSLSKVEVDALSAWAESGAAEGDSKDAPKSLEFPDGWRIGKPDAIIEIPKAFDVPASGAVSYQYITVPTGFTEDKWVTAIEIRPSNRRVVHHVNASAVRPASEGSSAAGHALGEFFTRDAEQERLLRSGKELPQFSAAPDSDLLETYVPGVIHPVYKPGQAKLIKAGSNITFQLHYTATGKPEQDRTRIGLIFAKEPPKERIKSILLYNRNMSVPAGAPNYPVEARAELVRDVRLVSILPHMHLRGKDFEVRATYPDGQTETLLRVSKYNFNWQINYYLAKPKTLPKGTILECLAHYDNSVNNPANPDPTVEVRYGDQTWEEMLNGFMEISMEPTSDTPEFLRKAPVLTSARRAP
jgi:hypothetical protein